MCSSAVHALTVALLSLLFLTCLIREGLGDSCQDMHPSGNRPTAAEPDSRPWMVLIWVSCDRAVSGNDNSTHSLVKTCEGALVREDRVLSAASCLQECGDVGLISASVDIGLHSSDIREEIASGRGSERISGENLFQ